MNVVCKNIKIRILLENPFDLTKQTNGFSVVNKRNLLILIFDVVCQICKI